jgi:hypothetical protein
VVKVFWGFGCVCKKVNMFLYFWNKMMLKIKECVMTLSKGANSSGLQVHSIVVRVNFANEGTRVLISNSRGTVEKAPVVLLQAT